MVTQPVDLRPTSGDEHVFSEFPKYRFPLDPNQFYIRWCLVPLEGRIAIVTDAGRDAVDVDAPLTNGADTDGEVVWS
jgi:hypothetical protein